VGYIPTARARGCHQRHRLDLRRRRTARHRRRRRRLCGVDRARRGTEAAT